MCWTAVCASIRAWNTIFETPEELAGRPACIYTNESQGTILRWQAPDGDQGQVTLKSVFRANNGDILRDLAARGHGLVFSPAFILRPAIKEGTLVQLFEGYRWAESSLYAVYPPTSHMPARMRALIDYLAGALKG